MRIAIFCETYLPYLNGVVTHIRLLKDGLEKQGHTVLVVTADPNTRRHYIADNVLHCPAIASKHFYGYGLASPFSATRMRFLRQFNADVFHVHQEFGIGAFGVMAAKRLQKPLVYTLHTMYDDYLYYVAPKPLVPMVRKILHNYSKILGNSAAELTGPSKKIEKYFQDVGVNKTVNIIPNPVELEKFSGLAVTDMEKTDVRSSLGIDPDALLAIFVGRLGKEKSVDVLLDYWAQNIKPEDNIHLLVIGEGPVRQELIKQAEKLGISAMVSIPGKVQHDELPPYYSAANAYITASLSDTYSISMLEGNASGLPTIQRFDPLNADQVVNGVNGYTFDSPASLGQALRLLRDMQPAQAQALHDRVLDRVKESGSDSLARYIVAVYRLAIEFNENNSSKKRWFRLHDITKIPAFLKNPGADEPNDLQDSLLADDPAMDEAFDAPLSEPIYPNQTPV